MTRKGSISVQTADIFPIIKKWLYSEHDIFIRELVANACDAITKRATLARNANQESEDGQILIELNKQDKTITIKDNGLGMSEEEVEKYIARLAFSGAEEFVKKMKESGNDSKNEIIGKFGLGFYSAFMVANKVEINSLSMNPGAKPCKWLCEGETEYTFENSTKTDIGTEIKLYINEDSKDFLDFWKLKETLSRHCDFMPYPIKLWDNEKKIEEAELINETNPLWKKDPTTLTDEDYKTFFQKLFPYEPEPLFWLHLNVDHPFTLQGVLYFPKYNPSKPIQENNIKLYSKQVFVSDNVKNVIPEFLGLLKGAIDSTDIPLNVSRSSLQGDPNIKKISNYIVKKVAESLKKLYNNDRARYETVWEDIQLFVKYGAISDEKFDEMMREYILFKNSEEKLVTLAEYQTSIPEKYKEKLANKYVYFETGKSDASLKQQLLQEGIHTIQCDNHIDPHFFQHTEMKKVGEKEYKFAAIDSEIENILETENVSESDMKLKDIFKESHIEEVEIKSYKNNTSAAYFKVDEQMKRFAQMAKSMGNSQFSMPTKKTLIINPKSPLIKNTLKIYEKGNKELASKLCHHVQDLATISSEGLQVEEKEKFVLRTQDLISELSNFAL